MPEKSHLNHRVQTDAEFGSQRIVAGMRAAIRELKTSHVSRIEIARFSGVTAPLVTYYFPDREALIEAATMPVVQKFLEEVELCLFQEAPPKNLLWDLINLILRYRSRDGSIIDAFFDLKPFQSRIHKIL